MSATQAQTAIQAPAQAPATPPISAQAIAVAERRTPFTDFRDGLNSRIDRLRAYLPEDVSLRRFVDTSMAAVANNPDLLRCNQQSLFNAIIKAARDKLMPDGREGALVPHKGVVQWRPMVYGLRRRFMEAGQLILDAQVVHEADSFRYELGDQPFIHHAPPDLRKRQPRGELCGAYCIVRRAADGSIVHREVMTAEEIERIRKMVEAQLKPGKTSSLWSKHTAEAYKKTVVHRLAKTVPLCAELAEIFERENEDIDWGADVEAEAAEAEAAAAASGQRPDPLRDPRIDGIDDSIPFVDGDVLEGIPEINGQAEMTEHEYAH